MRWSKAVIETMKENPSEAEGISTQLLIRAGFIRKTGVGLYSYLPLGFRALCKLEMVVRETMEKAQALEIRLAGMVPSGSGPTGKTMNGLVRKLLHSYRQLPLNLFHIHTQYPEDSRSRRGKLPSREWVALEAHSFDRDDASAQVACNGMHRAFLELFQRCGLVVQALADETAGKPGTTDFIIPVEAGGEPVLTCGQCGYAALEETARGGITPGAWSAQETPAPLSLVATPGQHSVTEVSVFLQIPPGRIAKTMLYAADGCLVAVIIRGDREVNETKLRTALEAGSLALATPAQILAATGAPVGFAGPFGLQGVTEILMDDSLEGAVNLVTGGNQAETHARNVNPGRDFQASRVLDLKAIHPGDACPRCAAALVEKRGLRVGQAGSPGISRTAPAVFLDERGEEQASVEGTYRLGISRLLDAVVEQNHDAEGIRWPLILAPFEVVLLPIAPRDPQVAGMTESVYQELRAAGLDVLWDDRDERAGGKFKDADLLGIPLRLTFGKSVAENNVELQRRDTGTKEMVPRSEIAARIMALRQEITRG